MGRYGRREGKGGWGWVQVGGGVGGVGGAGGGGVATSGKRSLLHSRKARYERPPDGLHDDVRVQRPPQLLSIPQQDASHLCVQQQAVMRLPTPSTQFT